MTSHFIILQLKGNKFNIYLKKTRGLVQSGEETSFVEGFLLNTFCEL